MWVDLPEIKRSRLQQVVRLSSLCGLGVLLLYSGLSWPMKVVAVLVLLGFSVAQAYAQQREVSLTSLQQLDRSAWQWQQRSRPKGGKDGKRQQQQQRAVDGRQIQARLLRVDACWGLVVILKFEVVALGQRQTWLVWRDQVDVDNWRRLQVLQQYWSAPLQPER